MVTGYVLYNLEAGYKTSKGDITCLDKMMDAQLKYIDIRCVKSYEVFLSGLDRDDFLVICGGDGTLNRFINDTDGLQYNCEVLYYPIGTGNDFATDLGYARGCDPFCVTDYIRALPYVIIQGKSYHFLNGIGYGIDSYCCEVGDAQKKDPDKKVNYTTIAIQGLLFHYKPTNATVTVDGVAHTYQKVWLAPTMYGRYYGGGMSPTPEQSRTDPEQALSTMVYYGAGKLKSLMVFPSIFKGEHVRHTEMVEILTSHEVTVEFDRPTALQIDGETILGVTSYTAVSPAKLHTETGRTAIAV